LFAILDWWLEYKRTGIFQFKGYNTSIWYTSIQWDRSAGITLNFVDTWNYKILDNKKPSSGKFELQLGTNE